jgi:diguanylate cyclase (GGDEF)-like protein
VLLYVLAIDVAGCVVLALAWRSPFGALAVLPAIVLHRMVLIRHLERVARTDEKTGVLNAAAWTRQARAHLARARRTGAPTAVFMLDLDGFKQVNDEHGHLAGDLVLRRVARVLVAEVRTGAVGRVGGDEFAVLLPATGVRDAFIVAERIRQEARRLRVPVARGLSASIGVAVYPGVAEATVEGLLAAADAALYRAKDNGRDQICLAGGDGAAGARLVPAAGGECPADMVSAGRRRR